MTAEAPPRPPLLNIANVLTGSRFVMAVVMFVMIEWSLWLGCLAVFVLAAITDWLDGVAARRYGLGSSLGRVMDPLADKVLTCGAFLFLLPRGTAEGWLLPWMVALIVIRELVISSLRSALEGGGVAFGADWLGKIKMVLQCAAIIAIFVALEVAAGSELPSWLWITRDVFIWAMLAATAGSGLQYLWRATLLLKDS